ncbi:SDR family oxidoreductase [Dolichospermum sp. UHCC 0259]|uniref:SDR family oxidoreductase n=1 Tax=Dolichospermum sp. UHCC 0259 TaxID=2590010 RepID=UPI0014474F65|nr:SDR family oxidoreductase [Dolichospermum sp. UHCC 0259]MTJ47229.1 SDR family oxidoreductase [Dolichospermum sp. UHCC 0259]
MNTNERLLVTGASGHLGQLVVEALLQVGQTNLIATTRQPEKLTHFASRGVKVRAADFNQPESLVSAFAGATRLLLISTMDVGSRIPQHKTAIAAAQEVGVQHIIYTSAPNPDHSPSLVAPDHAATEQLIRESGLTYTFLRNNLYAENLFYTLPTALKAGVLLGCAGDGKTAYVHRSDCAAAAAGALLQAEKFANVALDISGPIAYTHSELAELVAKVTGKNFVYRDVSPEELQSALVEGGLPDPFAQLFVGFDRAMQQGDLAAVTDAVQQLSGHSPQDITELLRGGLH